MRSVDPFLSARHRPGEYDCLHFARDVWMELVGEDLRDRLPGLLGRSDARRVARAHPAAFQRLPQASEPCLVLMRRRHTAPHVGVFLRGRVLHLHERGAEFQPLDMAARAFSNVRFYR